MDWRIGTRGLTLAALALCLSSLAAAGSIRHHKPVRSPLTMTAEGSELGQSSTLLPNGNWLLLGGLGSDGKSRTSAFVRDPETGSVSSMARGLVYARAWQSATILPDGTVFVFGGISPSGALVAQAEIYDPQRQVSRSVGTGTLQPRARHSATLLTDGQVLLAGGVDDAGQVLASLQIWNPLFGTVEAIAKQMLIPRKDQIATLNPDGSVLFWGGINNVGIAVTDGEVFDSLTQGQQLQTNPASTPSLSNAPIVEASIPSDDAANVSTNGFVVLRFSEALSVRSLNPQTVTLTGPEGLTPVNVVPAEGGMLVFATPVTALGPGTTYTLIANGAVSTHGIALPETRVVFTTAGNGSISGLLFSPSTLEKGPPTDGTMQNLPLFQAAAGVTAVSGRVLRLNGDSLANVTLQIDDHKTLTDRTGRFLLEGVSGGQHAMIIDANSASGDGRVYGTYEVEVKVKPGHTNPLNYTIWMTRIDIQHEVAIPSPTKTDTVITSPLLPGLELHIPANTEIRDLYGKVVTKISITPVPIKQPPFPLPLGVQVPIYFTIQPGGAYIDTSAAEWTKGATLDYPNLHHAQPGTQFDFWNYDPNQKGWYVYGEGTVSADGKSIVPNPGVEIYGFTGAMVASPSFAPARGPLPGNPASKDGEPVDLSTGLFIYNNVDLMVSDTIPINLTRTYRPADGTSRAFGIGSTHPYDIFMVGDYPQYSYADVILPDGESIYFPQTNPNYNWQVDTLFSIVFTNTDASTPFYGAKITWNNNGWTMMLKDGSSMKFPDGSNAYNPQQAALLNITNRYGQTLNINRTQIAGPNGGQITSIVTPGGRNVSFTYDSSNRITRAQDNIGRTVLYQYNANGYVSQVTDTNGGITKYTYDQSGDMTSIQDPRGITYLTNIYDGYSHVIKQIQGDSSTYLFNYTFVSGANNQITETDVTDPRGNIRKVTFNANSYIQTDVRAYGLPEQQTTTYNWDLSTNLLQSQVDPMGFETAYTYDAMGNVLTVTRMAGTSAAATTTLTYEPTHNLPATVSDALLHQTTFAHNGNGSLKSVQDPLGHTMVFGANASGQPITMTDPLQLGTVQFAFDGGDLVGMTDPLNRASTFYMDAVGRLSSVTDPVGNVTLYTYDSKQHVVQITDPQNSVTKFSYDSDGNLLSVKDARGNSTTFSYDPLGRIAARTDALGRTELYAYDTAGNLASFTDRRGNVTAYSYDGLNRRSSVGYGKNGSSYQSTINYTYDRYDRVTQASDSIAGNTVRVFNDLNRTEVDTTPYGSITYTNDAAGRRTSLALAGQASVNYTFDNANRLTQIAQGTSTVVFSYDSDNRRQTMTLPNGVVVGYSYDSAFELTGVSYSLGSTVLGSLSYTYDALGRRISTGGTFARTTMPAPLSAATYDAANELIAWGTSSLSYDANGNTTSDGLNTYTWDARNHLSAIGTGNSAGFQYDAYGRRVSKTVNGTTTNFVFSGPNIAQELSGGAVTANLLTGGTDEVLSRATTSGTMSFLSDALGSTIGLADSTGTLQTQYTYGAFGNGLNFTPANSYQYTGRENDGTSLYYYRARYYNPNFQRFLSEDPARFASGTANLYAYGENNPIQLTDPTGMTTARCRFDCAKNLANASALSGLYDKNKLPGVIGAVAGAITDNTVSGLVDLGDAWLDKDVARVAGSYALSGVYQGIPVGDGLVAKGVGGVLTDKTVSAAQGGTEAAADALGVGSDLTLLNLTGTGALLGETAAADAVPIVGWLKLGYDVVSFGTSLALCW